MGRQLLLTIGFLSKHMDLSVKAKNTAFQRISSVCNISEKLQSENFNNQNFGKIKVAFSKNRFLFGASCCTDLEARLDSQKEIK